jgi:hypothetical protein
MFSHQKRWLVGVMTALALVGLSQSAKAQDKAVYYDEKYGTNWLQAGASREVRDYFASIGYQVLDAAQLATYMQAHVTSKAPSIVVMGRDIPPDTVVDISSGSVVDTGNLIVDYMTNGGRVVQLGDWPFYNIAKTEGGNLNPAGSGSETILGIPGSDTSTGCKNDSLLPIVITDEGKKEGLTQTWNSQRVIPDATADLVLAESAEGASVDGGCAAGWIKKFGTGEFIRLQDVVIGSLTDLQLQDIKNVAQFGLTSNNPDTVAPGAITDLAASNPTTTSVTLTFTAPADTGTGSSGKPVGYEVRYSTKALTTDNATTIGTRAGGAAVAAAGAKETLTISGLDPLQSYNFVVRALDSAENTSAWSNSVNATTLAAAFNLPSGTDGQPGAVAYLYEGTSIPGDRLSVVYTDANFKSAEVVDTINQADDYDMNHGGSGDHYAIRYTFTLTFPSAGPWVINGRSDDGIRVWWSENPININSPGTPIVDAWVDRGPTDSVSAPLTVTPNKPYYMLVEYYENGGGALSELQWGADATSLDDIPTDAMKTYYIKAGDVSGGRINGSVLDNTGKPSANIGLNFASNGTTVTATSDANGNYSLLLTAGSYTVSAANPAGAIYNGLPTTPITVTGGQITNVPNVTAYLPPWDEGNSIAAMNDDFSAATLDSKWTSIDIGDSDGGSASIKNGQLDVAAGGHDIYDVADGFHFVYQKITGDFWATLKVAAIPDLNDWEMGGIMARVDTDEDSVHAYNQISPRHPIQNKQRDVKGAVTTNIDNDASSTGSAIIPAYVKIRRVGDKVAYYWTKDPVNGPIHLGSVRTTGFANTPDLLIGIAAASHLGGTTDDGFMYDDFKVGPISNTAPPVTLGDLNGDGKINVQDATTSLRIAVGAITPTDAQKKAGDVNGDGKWNVQDTTLILRRAVGAITKFPIEP